ncbi:MAG: hypothetical protein AVDCRST_MAG95-2938 [uncultured Adhaeribacter sp.]|uniref:Uncharacterized protein n=1 Tax=uncultured Adhaeribacter sp. TaxID=448109 RepID=A0A6J4JEE6_9BACT|nr:MAG: hypothetical protein AVDCRST_MAG95-2938 [uncultured Adhaeribacter sp.]
MQSVSITFSYFVALKRLCLKLSPLGYIQGIGVYSDKLPGSRNIWFFPNLCIFLTVIISYIP